MKGNLNETKTFFNPHPGFVDAIIILPAMVKKAADGLNGKKMPLSMAISIINSSLRNINGEVFVKDEAILLELYKPGGVTYRFRVINFY